MIVAHIAGVPVEEWLTPVAVSSTGIALALRSALQRLHRRK